MQCLAFKSKNEKIQCPCKALSNSNFCGRHKNTVNSEYNITINPIIEANESNESNKANEDTDHDNINHNKNETNNKIILHKPNILKQLEGNVKYTEYLAIRKNYIKCEQPRYIELTEYLENNKLDCYSYSRILASLEYYNLIRKNATTRFMLAVNGINILTSFFNTLLNSTLHINKIVKLQKWVKSRLVAFNDRIRGPGYLDRSLCVNDSDFVSLDDLKDIPNNDFISFRDDAGFIYGFSIDNLMELILKTDENYWETFQRNSTNLCYRQYIRTLYNHYNKIKINNPYTRFLIPGNVKLNVIRLHAQKKFINYLNNNRQNGIIQPLEQDYKVLVRNKCFTILQKIDMMGYFTDVAWLMDEQIKTLKLFYKKLANLWNFEFGLNNTSRYRISHTHNLFDNLHDIMISRADKYIILDKILSIMNILVSNGESEADRNSGAIIILYAFASVNPRCIQANPWLE